MVCLNFRKDRDLLVVQTILITYIFSKAIGVLKPKSCFEENVICKILRLKIILWLIPENQFVKLTDKFLNQIQEEWK
jgi:hypothetical protein